MTHPPKFTDFARQLNSHFTAHTRHGPVDLVLSDVRELDRGHRPDDLPTPVSLTFTSDAPIVLLQDTYRLDHPVLGTHKLFIVPVATGRRIPDYQVIIG